MATKTQFNIMQRIAKIDNQIAELYQEKTRLQSQISEINFNNDTNQEYDNKTLLNE